jgi:hypothetical protein
MWSVDLTAAFNLADVGHLIGRLKQIELPDDIARLIRLWLSNRSFSQTVNGTSSIRVNLPCGVIQGSILRPIQFAIYVSLHFDIC